LFSIVSPEENNEDCYNNYGKIKIHIHTNFEKHEVIIYLEKKKIPIMNENEKRRLWCGVLGQRPKKCKDEVESMVRWG